jgi:hypothetical protein
MKPIGAPIISGMVTSTIHVLIITPVIFVLEEDAGLASWHTPRLKNASLSRAIIQNALEDVLTRRIGKCFGASVITSVIALAMRVDGFKPQFRN